MNQDLRISRLLDPNQFVDKCVWCGCELPTDVRFQILHMEKEHNLIV